MAVVLAIAFFLQLASGFTTLHTTVDSACVGEDVTLSCATTSAILRWSITLVQRNVAPIARAFQSTDPVGRSHSISTSELQLDFELISNTMGILTSTFVVHTTGLLLNNANIRCEGTAVRMYTFRIARTPSKPHNITLSDRTYSRTASNVTVTWNSPLERVDAYYINASFGQHQQHCNMYISNRSKVVLEGIPYNEQINVNVTSVNCHSNSERAHFNFTINTCNKSVPLNGLLINNSSTKLTNIPDEKIMFSCSPWFAPQEIMTAICQESGLWNPDPTELLCLVECQFPIQNDQTVKIVASNGTVLGSKIYFKCQSDSETEGLKRAVCSSNGTWIPNPEKYECQTEGEHSSHADYVNQTIAGSVTGFLLLLSCSILGMAIFIIKCHKERQINTSEVFNPERAEPIYDTIGPAYEVIAQQTEAKLIVNINDAYNM